MTAQQPDDLTSAIVKLWIARALEGESQIDEHIQWNVESKARVPLTQMLTAVIGLLAVLLGLALIAAQLAHLLDLRLTPADYLFLLSLFLILLVVLTAAVRVYAAQSSRGVVAILVAALLTVLMAGILAAAQSARNDFSPLRAAAMAIGLALLLPGIALTYRMLVDLVDPFGKTSPMERMLYPHLSQIFGQTTAPAPPEPHRLVPHRVDGQTNAILPAGNGDIHDDDLRLYDFLHKAQVHGLSRASLVRPGHHLRIGPNRDKLTRPLYDDLVHEAEQWGFIQRGGEGDAHAWTTHPDEVLAILRAELERQRGAPYPTTGQAPGRQAIAQ